ncbi:MAG: UDP-N-acetylmuramate dehydrogenase [Patescibacteria group bacterium]|jgi:UDP-N-acetylmuramate dehydrogenase|nr:UDP-N-acetylmuramate dehydrogenase [Patescibacteria group bacterium]
MSEELKNILPGLQTAVSLAEYNTYKIGGLAKYFYIAKSKDDLLKAIQAAKQAGVEYTIIGWGSNILVADSGYDGLVIKNSSSVIAAEGEIIEAESGVNLASLIGFATRQGLSGLEFAAGIPGTLGGAIYGNAGAYGSSFSSVVQEVEVYQDGEVKKFSNEEMKFDYRHSILKERPGIILSVKMKLTPKNPKEIQSKVIETIKGRNAKLPAEPSCGCVFKNIDLSKVEINKAKVIKALDINEEEWEQAIRHGKLSVGYVIEKLGLKDKKIGGCQISPKHASYLINIEHAKAEHVVMLISDIKMRVRDELGIQLQEEVQYLGF